MLGLLRGHGYQIISDAESADILIVNTCGFIESAKTESIDTILEMAQYKTTGACKLLVVTGCLAQRYADDLMRDMPEIDLVLGVNQYGRLVTAIEDALGGARGSYCSPSDSFLETGRVLTTPQYSAYIRIGDGCDNRCAYCAIPLIRGKYRSRPMESVLNEVQSLAGQGVREHVLVAQDTTRYGTDWQKTSLLPELMKKAAQIPGVDWLRVLYCYPDEADIALLDAMADTPNICKYLDLPIQHIDEAVLRRMRRRGSPEHIRALLTAARDRGFALRTSIIVGFPGETEDDFKRLTDFLQEQQFDRLGAFAFSPEEGTPAIDLPGQVPQEVREERLDRLMKLQAPISLARNQLRIGTTARVLVTSDRGNGQYAGRSQWEAPEIDGEIIFTSPTKLAPGSFCDVRITRAKTYDLMGEKA
jgi:ribosomal protein S12 methylthiotransferase